RPARRGGGAHGPPSGRRPHRRREPVRRARVGHRPARRPGMARGGPGRRGSGDRSGAAGARPLALRRRRAPPRGRVAPLAPAEEHLVTLPFGAGGAGGAPPAPPPRLPPGAPLPPPRPPGPGPGGPPARAPS